MFFSLRLWCRGQQGVDPAWGTRQEALEHKGLQELPCMEKRIPHKTEQCSEQTVRHHELVDDDCVWPGHVTLVIAGTVTLLANNYHLIKGGPTFISAQKLLSRQSTAQVLPNFAISVWGMGGMGGKGGQWTHSCLALVLSLPGY